MAELSIVGGHVALDLVNTVDPRTPTRELANEHLPSPAALLSWSRRVGLLTEQESVDVARAWRDPEAGERALRTTVHLREAFYDIMLAALRIADDADAALDLVRRHWVAAIERSALRLDAAGAQQDGTDRLQLGLDPSLLVPDRLANASVELLRTLDVHQLKACPLDQGGCGFLFLDRSHAGTRRWCSMQDCGARAKARRLTARRQAERARGSRR